MKQGNVKRYRRDDGIWQDSGLILHNRAAKGWVAIFLAFQSQSWCADDNGYAINPVEECNYMSDC
ncbi:DUF2278 family protein [Bacillus thuringiensis]|nr:DUF2278 family protein [Bacillus thuringiensis]